MKNIFGLLAVFSMLTSSIVAQEFSYGFKGGLNLASLSNLDTEFFDEGSADSKPRISFHLGAVGEYKFSDKFSGQAELLYSGVGGKYEYSESGENYSYKDEGTYKLDYLSVPILAKYYVNESLSLEGGLQLSFLLSAKEDYESKEVFDGETDTYSYTEDISEYLEGTDFGLAVGGTYNINGGMFLSLRYVLGLSNINKIALIKNKNRVLQFSVGYKFN